MPRILAIGLLALASTACATKAGPDQDPPANPPAPAFTVVALGDSYAAGQGAPNQRFEWWKPWNQARPVWENHRCNRSRYAPTSQVVERLRQAGKAVRLHNHTCSGADIENGLLEGYAGQEPDIGVPLLDPQVKALKDHDDAEPAGVQAATISIGGNDIFFARIIAACVVSKECEVIDPVIDIELAKLPDKLATLDSRLDPVFPGEPWRVLLMGYPDLTQASDGSPCNRRPRWDALGRIDAAESAWAASVVKKLNHRLCTAAHLHGWTWVSGPAAYEKHGWCASDNWIRTAGESSARQRTIFGTLHPSQAGHSATADALEASLTALVGGNVPSSAACVAP